MIRVKLFEEKTWRLLFKNISQAKTIDWKLMEARKYPKAVRKYFERYDDPNIIQGITDTPTFFYPLDDAINAFFGERQIEIKLVDIKYQFEYEPEGYSTRSALVIYEVK